jgi:hypothetical protein
MTGLVLMCTLSRGVSGAVLQEECAVLSHEFQEIMASPPAACAASYSTFYAKVCEAKCRWRLSLVVELGGGVSAVGLHVLSFFLDTMTSQWASVVLVSGHLASDFCLLLCNVIPIAAYNEAVIRTRLSVEHFPTAQRLSREPVEFSILSLVVERSYFRAFLISGVSSSLSALVSHWVSYMTRSPNVG